MNVIVKESLQEALDSLREFMAKETNLQAINTGATLFPKLYKTATKLFVAEMEVHCAMLLISPKS